MQGVAAMVFDVVVVDPRGRVATRQVRASTRDEASRLAGADGATVVECASPVPRHRKWAWQAGLADRAPIDAATFAFDLATLLDAGVTAREAVAALAKRERSASAMEHLSRLHDRLVEGASLSAALQRSGIFPPLIVATVEASEQTGDLAAGLGRFARHYEALRAVRDRVVGACVYPMLLVAVGTVVVCLLLAVVVPRFARLVDLQDRDLPVMSRWLMAWGRLADAHPVVPIAVFSLLAAAAVLLARQALDPEARKRWLERVPGIAGVVREFQHLQLYRTAAILTARGIVVHKALAFCENLLGPTDRARLSGGIARMYEGVPLSAGLCACGLADVVATSMLNVAERSGALPEMLDRVADFYERSLQRRIDIVSRLVEPVLMIVFGTLIGAIVVMMYLPIFDLASSIG
jgi:general secretion pathway protein F